MANMEKTKQVIKKIRIRKPHLDFIAAVLTIPVLLSVLVINFANINSKKTTQATPTIMPTFSEGQTPQTNDSTQTKTIIVQVTPVETSVTSFPTPNPDSCTKGIAPINISYPQENQTVSDNPLCISIDYTQGNYCSVVWAYKINNGNFSDYSNNSVCLYNIPTGNNTFTLQVKSLVNSDTKTIDRHFTYSNNQVTNTPTPVASSSATTQQ